MDLEKNIFLAISTVLIVDDKPKNLLAAKEALQDIFPAIKTLEAASAVQAIEIIANQGTEIDLVLSDMEMEELLSGFYVAFEAWSNYIPTVVVTAGDHHGAYVVASSWSNPKDDGSTLYHIKPAQKDDKEVWKKIIRGIEKNDNFALRVALYVREEKGGTFYNKDAGEILARLTCTQMGNIRDCKV